jgi:hypothetical protein
MQIHEPVNFDQDQMQLHHDRNFHRPRLISQEPGSGLIMKKPAQKLQDPQGCDKTRKVNLVTLSQPRDGFGKIN